MSIATATLAQPTRLFDLEVSVSAEASTTVITVRGEADPATLPVLVDALTAVIAGPGGDVVVDLTGTAFMDTAALRAMIRAKETLAGRGRKMTLRSPSRAAARVLSVFGLSDLVGQAPAA